MNEEHCINCKHYRRFSVAPGSEPENGWCRKDSEDTWDYGWCEAWSPEEQTPCKPKTDCAQSYPT
jgi:hypothetical protein